jgi:phage repressor protein C with HTH and peptisase S24 domain
VNNEKAFDGAVLREFRKAHKLTQEELAPVLEICRTWLARLETGNKVPSIRLQEHIAQTLARYDADRRLAAKLAERPGFSDHALPARLRSRDIPVVSWAAAGKASDYEDLASQIDETVGTLVTDPNAFAVIVEGDSMEPEVKAGDRVVIAPNLEPRNGDIVLVKMRDGRVMLKKFGRVGPSGGTIRLLSENLNYDTLEFSAEEVRWVYPAMEFKRMMRR